MLNLNSRVVQQQIKDGILDPTKIEYVLCLTEVDKAKYGDSSIHTQIVSRKWHEKLAIVKADKTVRLNCDKELLRKFKENIAKNIYVDTFGADGAKVTAACHRTIEQDIINSLEHPQRRWFIAYHDDKFLYDLETGVQINVEQPSYVLTDLTIFNN